MKDKTKKEMRENLMDICEANLKPEKYWHDRNAPNKMEDIGILWALLGCGCDFEVLPERSERDKGKYWEYSDENYLRIKIFWYDFTRVENGKDYKVVRKFTLKKPDRMCEHKNLIKGSSYLNDGSCLECEIE